jgi:hypothetical protein
MQKLRMKYFIAVLSVLIGSATPVQADVLFQQMPGPSVTFFSGPASGNNGQELADDFSISSDGFITSLKWVGIYVSPAPAQDDFTLKFYADNNGKPGSGPTSYSIGSIASRTYKTSFDLPAQYDPNTVFTYLVYTYEYNLNSPFGFGANNKYWISITNNVSSWGWNELYDHHETAAIKYSTGDWLTSDQAWNLSFELDGAIQAAPEPSTMLLLGFGLLGIAGVRRNRT